MLDSATKRRIDSARDILVGKVPDPKSQVEQITIALIYKFMDDMDLAAEEAGGKRKFFAGEFAKYGWAKLMAQSTAGEERIALYGEGIVKMPQNPGIPPLFRNIFKNAFLPYRDPETLKLFLKEIDGFTYDHSERLGDAFEYLLSVLGSQGDAGQFRTPRHIIDFMVKVVDPKKTDTILDPACGTAGFLISAYKHIVSTNYELGIKNYELKTPPIPNSQFVIRNSLTPDEKRKLAANLRGYDISPDMVRLSLVNLYLHGFNAPQIDEYDTLTSQEKWNEVADVILANPPFMSPKGGIKPHDRFGVRSKRSEVLFVDYMAEHLTPTGRAGIIVPEGIIFQSQTAYVSLRKMLVENYLVAVVSLPQGVFNPYSGVKTSILLLDKMRAKRTKSILFVKITDDGHDLGATRRQTGEGQLPAATELIARWCTAIDNGTNGAGLVRDDDSHAVIVSKEEIAADGDHRLTADTYRKCNRPPGLGVEWVALGSLLSPSNSGRAGENQSLPILSITMRSGLVDQGDKFKKRIASADIGTYKKVLRDELVVGFPIDEGVIGIQQLYDAAAVSPAYDIWTVSRERLDLEFFELIIRSHQARARYRLKMRGTAGRRRTIDKRDFLDIEIPLPPLSVQKEIVAEIEGYQKVIDGARAVLDHYRPHIPIQPDWPMVELAEIAEINPKKSEVDDLPADTVVSFVPMADLGEHAMTFVPQQSKPLKDVGTSYTYFRDNDVLVAKVTPCFENGKAGIARNLLNGIGFGSSEFFVIRCSERLLPEWAFFSVANAAFRATAAEKMTGTGGLQRVPRAVLEEHAISLPALSEQERIVSEIEAEQRLVAGNRELIGRFEKKIQQTLARVWGEAAAPVVEALEIGITN